MARIAGVDLPRDKRVEVALTYIYGIGHTSSEQIVKQANIDPATRVKNLSEEELSRLRNILEKNYKVEDGVVKIENFDKINLGDVNAI